MAEPKVSPLTHNEAMKAGFAAAETGAISGVATAIGALVVLRPTLPSGLLNISNSEFETYLANKFHAPKASELINNTQTLMQQSRNLRMSGGFSGSPGNSVIDNVVNNIGADELDLKAAVEHRVAQGMLAAGAARELIHSMEHTELPTSSSRTPAKIPNPQTKAIR